MTEVSKFDGKSEFEIKVNGIAIEVKQEKMSVSQILELAKDKGAFPGESKDYILQGDKKQYGPEDVVDFREDTEFITIPNRPTPVA